MIFAIDPGNVYSAYAILNEELRPIKFGKVENLILVEIIGEECKKEMKFAIEMVASYGMAVGKEVFDTCVWIGRFLELIQIRTGENPNMIYRKEEKMNLCGTMRAKDSNIRQALIDRFGPVGTKKKPGWFYGVKADVWAAIAVGVTYHDLYLK